MSKPDKPIRELGCTCCGSAFRGRQWWNQDTGHGLCNSCIPFVEKSPDATPEWMAEAYGRRGYHYGIEGVGERL